jgi:hypothetical protein
VSLTDLVPETEIAPERALPGCITDQSRQSPSLLPRLYFLERLERSHVLLLVILSEPTMYGLGRHPAVSIIVYYAPGLPRAGISIRTWASSSPTAWNPSRR